MEQFSVSDQLIYLTIIATLVITVIVISIFALYKYRQKKNNQTKLIQVIIATAQANAMKNMQ